MSATLQSNGEVVVKEDPTIILLPTVVATVVKLANEAPVTQTVAPVVVKTVLAPSGPATTPTSWFPIATHGGSAVAQVFTVKCTSAWTATCGSTGMVITGGSGTGSGSFTCTYTPSGGVGTSAIDIVVTQTAGTVVQHVLGTASSV